MRALVPAIAVIATLSAAHAQTYALDYPVCLQVYGRAAYNECTYISIEQCRPSAVGRSATCIHNPFFHVAGPPPGPRPKRNVH